MLIRHGAGREEEGKGRGGPASDGDVEVELVPTVRILHEKISEALCDVVFHGVRRSERQRKWSLFALARFWLVVIPDAPRSSSQLSERTRRAAPEGFLPRVAASAEAFFQKFRDLSSAFFMALYHRFIEAVLAEAPIQSCALTIDIKVA